MNNPMMNESTMKMAMDMMKNNPNLIQDISKMQ